MPDRPIDLALIQMVQRARMAHDADARPSQISAVYWIEVRPDLPVPGPTARAGLFELAAPAPHIDAVWEQVRAATCAGQLGYKSKVATAPRADDDTRIIHVLLADAHDAAEVARVRAVLASLGLQPIDFRLQRDAGPPAP